MSKEFILVPKFKYYSLIRHKENQDESNHPSLDIQPSSQPSPTGNITREDVIELIKGTINQQGNGGMRGKLINGPPGEKDGPFKWLPY